VKTHTHVSLSDNPTFDPKQKVIILHNVVKKTCNIFLYNEKSKQYISCYPYVVVFFFPLRNYTTLSFSFSLQKNIQFFSSKKIQFFSFKYKKYTYACRKRAKGRE
jgi:hypothetical protein